MLKPVLRFLLLLVSLSFSPLPQGRPALDLEISRQPVPLLDWGDAWVDTAGRADIRAVEGKPRDMFQPTDPGRVYALKPGQALWIRLNIPAAPDNERWYLKLPNPGLDRVSLYTRGAEGEWTAQVAGDLVPVSSWPIPNLYPVFPLVVSAAEPTYYALRVEASSSFNAPIVFESESGLSASQQRVSALYGMYFGLLAMVALFAASSAAAVRDVTYFYFSLWATALMLALASTVGMAGMHLWPQLAGWSDAAKYVLPVLSFAPLLMFVAHVISLPSRGRPLFLAFAGMAVINVVVAGLIGLLPGADRLQWAVAVGAGSVLLCLGGMGWTTRVGDRFAAWLLLALLPLLVAIPFPLARLLQWDFFGSVTPYAILFGVAVTLPMVFQLLMLRSQERRDYQRRITQLDRVDPATGLVNDTVFQHRMRGMIARSVRLNHQSMVVMVDFSNRRELVDEFGRRAVLEVILRLAGRLTSLVRDVDTVARLGDSRFGMLIEGPVPPKRMTSLASKIMVHCITPFGGLFVGLVVKPKISVLLVPEHAVTVEAAMQLLDNLLLEANPGHHKAIFTPGVVQHQFDSTP